MEHLKQFGPANPLLILWGPATLGLVTPSTANGVTVIAGKDLEDWWLHHPIRDAPLTSSDLDTVWNELSARCDVMEPEQPDKPPSLLQVTVFATVLIALGLVGFVAALQALTHLPLPRSASLRYSLVS